MSKYVLAALGVACCAFAQEAIQFSSVSGRITDPAGGVAAGARITARQIETNIASSTSSDRNGRFRFPLLKPGPYDVVVKHGGFADAKQTLTVTLGSAFDLQFSLTLETAQSNVPDPVTP